MTPGLGTMATYRLTSDDAVAVNRRRFDALDRANALLIAQKGSQTHVGNAVAGGDVFPMMVVRRWPYSAVNGQVFLDGNDTLWVTSVTEGDECGQFTLYRQADA